MSIKKAAIIGFVTTTFITAVCMVLIVVLMAQDLTLHKKDVPLVILEVATITIPAGLIGAGFTSLVVWLYPRKRSDPIL